MAKPLVTSHGLFSGSAEPDEVYRPAASRWFAPERIVLAKGSLATAQRRRCVEAVRGLYPEVEVIEQLDTPHNRVDLGKADPLALHGRGKKTLVFGVHNSAVRRSREQGNTCPNYWYFSPYGFCPFGCAYCYLAGTQGVRFSPTVKIFLNLDEMLAKIDRIARRIAKPTAFYLGKLQDGLALDPLTGYSRELVRFFADHPYARMTLLTKSDEVANLLGLNHREHTILSWTLSPPEVWTIFEPGTPSPDERIDALRRCADAGYPVRAVVMPLIPLPDWRGIYSRFIRALLSRVPLQRLTLGSVCIFRPAQDLMERRLGRNNAISESLRKAGAGLADGRSRFDGDLRIRMYQHLAGVIRELRPDLTIGICLEEICVFNAVGRSVSKGKCNCVL